MSQTTTEISEAMPAKSNLLVIGHGHCGVNSIFDTLRRSDPGKDTYLGTMVIESNKRALSSFNGNTDKKGSGSLSKWLALPERFRRIQIGDTGLGTGGDIEEGEKIAKNKLELITPYLKEFDNVIQIGGGGGGTCGSMPVVAEVLRELDIPTYAMLTLPTIMEGPRRAKRARMILNRMRGICPTLTINNEEVPDKSLSPSKIQREINEMSIFWALPFLKSLLQEYCEVQDPDGNDWKKWTKVGRYTTIGHFNASKGFEGYEKGLLGNPYLDSRIIKKALAIGFLFKGKWPYNMIEEVIGFVSGKVQETNKSEEFELKWGSKEEGVPRGVRTVGFVAFAEEGPDEEEQKTTRVVAIEKEVPPVNVQEVKQEETQPAPVVAEENPTHEQTPTSTPSPVLVMPTHDSGNINDTTQKVSFFGPVRGVRTEGKASKNLVDRYAALHTSSFSSEKDFNREAHEVLEALFKETRLMFDVPSRH